MPRITLYVRGEDHAIWERARILAEARGDSLSGLVATALDLVAGHGVTTVRDVDAMGPVELTGVDWRMHTRIRTVRFVGLEIGQVGQMTAYRTRGGQIVLVEWALMDERFIVVFESFAALQADPIASVLDHGLLDAIAAAAGAHYVEVLD